MKKLKKILSFLLISSCVALGVSACGGGGGGGGGRDDAGESGSGSTENSPINEIPVPSVWSCTWENAETTTVSFETKTTLVDDGIPANWEYAPGSDGKTGVLTFTYLNTNPQVKAVINVTFTEKGRGNISSTVYADGSVYSREIGTIQMR